MANKKRRWTIKDSVNWKIRQQSSFSLAEEVKLSV